MITSALVVLTYLRTLTLQFPVTGKPLCSICPVMLQKIYTINCGGSCKTVIIISNAVRREANMPTSSL